VTIVTKSADSYVYICTGSDCIKDKKKLKNLRKTLASEAKIKTVKCQKICDGPVAGVMLDGDITWFERLGSAKHRESLLRLLQTGKANKTLKKHVNKKRAGKLR